MSKIGSWEAPLNSVLKDSVNTVFFYYGVGLFFRRLTFGRVLLMFSDAMLSDPALPALFDPALFNAGYYWLRNAHVPASLIIGGSKWTPRKPPVDHLLAVDIEIEDGLITTIMAAGTFTSASAPSIDLQGGIVLACFAELHTHLDKGHTEGRTPNPDGSFAGAIGAVGRDAKKYWTAADVYRRMEFGLKCSYAHGTKALRTHLDSAGKQGVISWEVFEQLRSQWSDRVDLQAVALVSLEYYVTPAGEKLADLVAQAGFWVGWRLRIRRWRRRSIGRLC
jgi:cytosine/creatinine deaminase